MSDFSDKPLVAGSLTGLRAFNVDRLGRLTSPQRFTIYTPGENIAECKKSMDYMWALALSTVRWMPSSFPTSYYTLPGNTFSFGYYPAPPAAPKVLTPAAMEASGVETEKPKHTAGNIECACGWYAYFDGSNEYSEPTRLSALIEGYGTATLGTRGFRAEKSRLLAIIAPKKSKVPADRLARVMHNYPDVPVYATKRQAIEAHPLTPPAVATPE